MKILVTGGAGFIGSHIVDAYIDRGHQVHVIDNLSTGDKKFLNPKATFHEMDITSSEIIPLMKKHCFDLVNHHAAQIDVRKSVSNPVEDGNINILGTLNLLQGAVETKVQRFIYISSGGAIYGDLSAEELPVSETHSINPLSPYGASKHAMEHYLYLYRKLYNLSYFVLRYSNVYGERQGKSGEAGVISIFARQLLQNKVPYIFGDGEQLRDYVYVKDVVDGNMKVSFIDDKDFQDKHFNDRAFNIGTGIGTSVNYLYKLLKTISQSELDALYEPKRDGEIEKIFLDIKKAEEGISWVPKYYLDEGLNQTFCWFQNNPYF